jgi:hypothetical protein
MTVFKKLQKARRLVLESGIEKTGHNKFSNYKYFELGDFIPVAHKIFDEVGLCGVVSFGDRATLTIFNADEPGAVEFATPIVYAENAKGQAIQSLGSTHTYLRRYLWLLALELVENDVIDSLPQEEKPKAAEKAVEKPEPKLIPNQKKPVVIDKGENFKEWEIKVRKVDDEAEWPEMIVEVTNMALSFAKTAVDVQSIFKNNRGHFDKLKSDYPTMYEDLLANFKTKKDSFAE